MATFSRSPVSASPALLVIRGSSFRRLSVRRLALAWGLAGLAAWPLAAHAEGEAPAAKEGLEATLGVAVVNRPTFLGSDERETRLAPIASLSYGRFFLGPVPGASSPLGLGADLWRGQGVRLGVALLTDIGAPREEDDDARLFGLGDVKATQYAALYGSYEFNRFAVRSSVAHDVGDHGLGTVANFEAQVRFQPTPTLMLSVGPGLTWRNQESMQTLWGIDENQSLRSGRAVYRPDSGLSQWQLSAGAMYRLSPHWSLGARAAYVRLQGDAADSPLAFRRSQSTFGVFTAYRF